MAGGTPPGARLHVDPPEVAFHRDFMLL